MNNIKSVYQEYLNKYTEQSNIIKKRLKQISLLRSLSFLAIFVTFYILFDNSWILSTLSAFIFLSIFLFLVRIYINKANQFEFAKKLASINKNELEAINGNYSHFNDGKEFINKDHDFTFDLDIFGEGSLFQFLNRSAILIGVKKLAQKLFNPILDHSVIKKNQEAITDLAGKLEWRQKFIAYGNMSDKYNSELDKLDEWLNSPSFFRNKQNMFFLVSFLSFITILLLALVSLKLISNAFIVTTIFYQLSFYTFFFKRINLYHAQISKYSKILDKYAQLLNHIESQQWNAELIKTKVEILKNGQRSSIEIKKLASLVGTLDSRLNFLLGFLLNWILLWDLQCIIKLENWKQKNKENITSWFDILAEIDALQSLSNFKYNHPAFTIPEIKTSKFIFSSENLGHPLIHEKERVCNNFSMIDSPKFSIITGANMAGKSTFLRTIGVNLVLAMCGAPVCALKFVFTPIKVFSSMRTDDSLQRHRSYFFAELERLKTIFEKVNNGEKLFLILDEILKGTNSKDKEKGSKAFMKKLMKYDSNGIIATHDLSLGELETKFPENINNLCFEVKINEKELDFDYKLYHGITKNLNASYLMNKMGIV